MRTGVEYKDKVLLDQYWPQMKRNIYFMMNDVNNVPLEKGWLLEILGHKKDS